MAPALRIDMLDAIIPIAKNATDRLTKRCALRPVQRVQHCLQRSQYCLLLRGAMVGLACRLDGG